MDAQQIFDTFPFMLPAQTALICILLLLRLRSRGESPLGSKPILVAVAAYASSGLGLASIALYITIPGVYAALGVPIMWCFMTVNVLYYQFIFELTKTRAGERFSGWHYFAPVLITGVYLVWSLLVPFDVQRLLVESKSEIVDGYQAYSWFSSSKPLLFSIFMAVYGVMTIRRARRFHRAVVHYSADEQRTSLSWLYQITYAMLGMLPLALAFVLLSNRTLTSTPVVAIPLLFFIFRDVMLAHNILTDNFVVISAEANDQPPQNNEKPISRQTQREEVRCLESYMRKAKPYLKPKLKITDITIDLNTNRTALSLLINRTYGMNFSRFVNRYRLTELERLEADPANLELSEPELITKAGFSDWRGYLRVKQREDEFLN